MRYPKTYTFLLYRPNGEWERLQVPYIFGAEDVAQPLPPATLPLADEQLQRNERLVLRLGDHLQVGMGPGRHLGTRGTLAAGIERGGRPLATQQRLAKLHRKGAFADPPRPGEQKATRQPPARKRLAELLDHVVVSVNVVPGHGWRGAGGLQIWDLGFGDSVLTVSYRVP